MITVINLIRSVEGDELVEMACLSTDTKPTDGIANGSACIEMDTGDKYMFDEAGGQWIKLGSGGGGQAEVWLVGDNPTIESGSANFILRNVDATDHITELFNNASNYDVYLNGVELAYFADYGAQKLWTDNSVESATMCVQIDLDNDVLSPRALYVDATTAPTSVEVSVKAK